MVPLCSLVFIVWSWFRTSSSSHLFSKVFVEIGKLLRCLIDWITFILSCPVNGLKNIISLSWLQLFLLSRQVPHSHFRGIHQARIRQFISSRATVTLGLLPQLGSYWLDPYQLISKSVPSSISKDGCCWIKLYFWRSQQPTSSCWVAGTVYYWCWYRPPWLADTLQVSNSLLLNPRLPWQQFYLCGFSSEALLPADSFYNKVVSTLSQTENCNHVRY